MSPSTMPGATSIFGHFLPLALILILHLSSTDSKYSENGNRFPLQPTPAERTHSIALLVSFIQCFPNTSNTGVLDDASKELLHIHQTFNPESHLDEYANLTDIQTLLNFVHESENSGKPNNLPFTNAPIFIAQLQIIVKVLYHNSDNWPLFYNTSVWLLQRVNTAMLYWAVMTVAPEKYSESAIVPSVVEAFPQLYLPKNIVLAAAGLQKRATPLHPLQYWMSDPGVNEFHTRWHMENPFWWDVKVYGVRRDRKGELFFYMHHQIVCRFNAELLSNGLPEVGPMGLTPDYRIPEGFVPDIVNVNYQDFFSREDNFRIGDFDVDGTSLAVLRDFYQKLMQGIEQGYLIDPQGNHVDFTGENGTSILGSTTESATMESVNWPYYGSLHNYMHRILGGTLIRPIPGIESHPETSMRDPVFYHLHEKLDILFKMYKATLRTYNEDDLDFPGISLLTVNILTRPHGNLDTRWRPTSAEVVWPLPTTDHSSLPPTLTTFFRDETFDITNAARPCRSIDDAPVPATTKILDYVPFTYVLAVQSMRPTLAYGMVRIFIWPEHNHEGKPLEGDAAHQRAIELDRFLVRIEPGRVNVITRSSLDSTLTRVEPAPGIKKLYNVKSGSGLLTRPEMRRGCAFPNNLLIPRGNKEGIPFKLTAYISEETDAEEVEKNQFPHYPLCGALHGLPFPDKRPMGFPFDRPGTRFNLTESTLESSPVFGCTATMKNVKEIKLVIKHDQD